MKCRCLDSNHPSYKNYGARGITICPEWIEDYRIFRKWSHENGYSENLELDRIDVNGNYEPANCRWITHHEQTMNRRDTLYIEAGGQITKLRDFCRENGFNIHTVTAWRQRNILEEKMELVLGQPVRIFGGQRGRSKV